MKNIFKKLAIITSCVSIAPSAITLSCCAPEIHPEIGGIIGGSTLQVGETARYITQISPVEADQTIVWSTSDSTIAEINSETGELTALKEGVVNVIAESTIYNLAASKSITIIGGQEDEKEHVVINGPSQIELFDNTQTFTATGSPKPISPPVIYWSVSDAEVGEMEKNITSTDQINHFIPHSLGYVTITATSRDGKITGSKTIEVIPPTPVSWETDSWQKIGFYADQGIVALAEAYPDEYAREDLSRGKIGNSFVGSVKELQLPNSDNIYNAIVIGQEHDIVADTQLPATLTFQFAQVLTSGSHTRINKAYNSKKWYKEYDNTWFTSNTQYSEIRTYLTSTVKNNLETALGTKIKAVEKTTLVGGTTENTVNSIETVFIPSVSEIYHKDAIKTTDFTWSEKKMRDYADDYALEGSQYEFYGITVGHHDPNAAYEPKKVKLYYIDTRKCCVKPYPSLIYSERYWLRTPFINPDEAATELANFAITGDELTEQQGKIRAVTSSNGCGVAPCFCL